MADLFCMIERVWDPRAGPANFWRCHMAQEVAASAPDSSLPGAALEDLGEAPGALINHVVEIAAPAPS